MRYGFVLLALISWLLVNSAQGEEIVQTTVCEVISDPPEFDHKLIELEGVATQGMENFSLATRPCHQEKKGNYTGIWLEYGGRVQSGAKFCCGVSTGRDRPEDLSIDGISTSIVQDDLYRAFDARVHPSGRVRARLIGRYFAGKRNDSRVFKDPNLYLWGGYGHMGMSSLLIVQQVVWVEPQKKADRKTQ